MFGDWFSNLRKFVERTPNDNLNMADSSIKFDRYHKKALKCIADGENLFITGKAGTGKTTLLREIKERFQGKKVVAVLAPTGVAAENAEGYTMHSFLRLPLKPYLPQHKVLPNLYQLDEGGADVVRNIDILIIDEISMVRCDMLDATDMILRHYRNSRKPFGGVQLVMFGDLYQLCPVVKNDEWETLKEYYKSLYFFSCYAFQKLKYKVVELKNVYRQDDRDFIDLLNNIRTAKVQLEDIHELDARFEPKYVPKVKDNVVTLMTHIRMTEDWNDMMFSKVKNKSRTYDGKARNWFGERFPVKYHLELKVGARVMFQRNDNSGHQYVNGTLGWVKALYDDSIVVIKDNGELVNVERAKWEQYDYFVDKKTKTIYTEVSGTYTQFPLKLAWAVSIHKSQGLTFDEVAIDAAKSFTFGQVYVALSRCRTLDGIHLLSQIPSHKIIADDVVIQYMDCIDKDGNVNLPEEFEPIKYETGALELNVRRSVFCNIRDGVKKLYKHTIYDNEYAQKMFLHKGNKVCINKIFSSVKKEWSYWDTNGGHCPFVIRQYKKAIFICHDMGQKLYVDIDGTTEVYQTVDPDGYDTWAFKFRIGKVKKSL